MRAIPQAALLSVIFCFNSIVQAQLTSPQIGWQTELSTRAHGVSGSVTILDENTIQVDDFTYDGGGIDVYFYLGHENSKSAFQSGLPIGSQLLGTAYTGTGPPLVIDLPTGQTLEGWKAISVWCVTADVSFGDGTFAPIGSPPPGDFNDDGSVDAADYVAWRNGLGAAYDEMDYADWRANFGVNSAAAAAPNSGALAMSLVPEPATLLLLSFAVMLGLLGWRASSHWRVR